jgi:hypothetical protein
MVVVPALMGDMREDEFLCEEAHAHLTDCCPGFKTAPGVCEYVDGCDESTYPALPPAESNCIRAKSCQELVDQGICERAANMHVSWSTSGSTDAGVCP